MAMTQGSDASQDGRAFSMHATAPHSQHARDHGHFSRAVSQVEGVHVCAKCNHFYSSSAPGTQPGMLCPQCTGTAPHTGQTLILCPAWCVSFRASRVAFPRFRVTLRVSKINDVVGIVNIVH